MARTEGTGALSAELVKLRLFALVLRIVFRRVMDVTFVIKVRGMDGDDSPCHPASLHDRLPRISYPSFRFLASSRNTSSGTAALNIYSLWGEYDGSLSRQQPESEGFLEI